MVMSLDRRVVSEISRAGSARTMSFSRTGQRLRSSRELRSSTLSPATRADSR